MRECPASYHSGSVNGEDRVHFASEKELAACGGVCAACREKFRKHALRNGTEKVERYQYANGVAFLEDSRAEPITMPDVEGLDDAMQTVGMHPEAVEAIARFCRRLFEIGGSEGLRGFYQAAHAACFAAQLHPMQDRPGEAIAKVLGITKAAFFKHVNHFRDLLNLPRVGGAKSNEARLNYRKTQRRTWKKRRQAVKENGSLADLLARVS